MMDDSDRALAAVIAEARRGRPRWQRRAACLGVGVASFFPARGETTATARSMCALCPVTVECLAMALDDPHTDGLWAATTRDGRARLRRQAA